MSSFYYFEKFEQTIKSVICMKIINRLNIFTGVSTPVLALIKLSSRAIRIIEISMPTSLSVRRAFKEYGMSIFHKSGLAKCAYFMQVITRAPRNTLRRSFFRLKAMQHVPMRRINESSAMLGRGWCLERSSVTLRSI
jgi:hypothetical protein